MKFWGTEVRPEQTVSCSVDNEHFIHVSQVALGKTKKQSEKVVVSVKVDDTEMVIGTLSAENHPHFPCDLIFEKEFELSHSSKTASVFFSGYKAAILNPFESSSNEEEDEEEPTKLAVTNQVIDEEEPNKLPVLSLVSDKSKGNATANDGKKDKDEDDTDGDESSEDDSDEYESGEDDSDEDESGEDDSAESDDDSHFSSSSDDMTEDETSREEDDTSSKEDVSSSEEDESGQEDAVIPKSDNGNKRVAETALKTTASDKKAKIITPSGQKTGDKKGIHVATPYPTKQASKTASGKSMEKSPKSTGGSHVCKSCSMTFGTDSALQSHDKAKPKGAA